MPTPRTFGRPFDFLFPARLRIGRLGFLTRLLAISAMGGAGSHLVSIGIGAQITPTEFNPAGFSGAILLTVMLCSFVCSVIGRARDIGIKTVAALAIFVLLPVIPQVSGNPSGILWSFVVQALLLLALLVMPGMKPSCLIAHNDA